jgi:hypothetical protein
MNLRSVSLALALSAMALHAQAEDRAGQDRYKSTAAQSAHADKMRQSIDARIARASAGYEKATKATDASAQLIGLVSFSERLTPAHLTQLRAACACQIVEVQRTIGETQMAWNASAEQLSSEPFMRNLESEYRAHLESVISELEVELKQEPSDSPQSRYSRQKLAAFSTALAEARSGGVKFNGVVFAATPTGLAAIKAQAPVLAIEIMTGSQRRFAIPLEIYQ